MNALIKTISGFLLFCCMLLLHPVQTIAQSIFYSKEEGFNFQNGDFDVIGKTGNYTYTYTASGKGYLLNAYNDSMSLKATIALDFFPAKIDGVKFINYPENIIVFYQAEERNYIIQYAALLDNKALLIENPIALDSVKSSWFGSNQRFFKVTCSSDKQKIMVYGIGRKNISTTLLNNQLQLLHHEEHSFTNSDYGAINQTLLDDRGRFYFTLTNESGSKNYTNTFQLFQLSQDGKEWSHHSLPGSNFYYSGMHSKININNDLIYTAGFYSDKKNGNLEGVAYTEYNPQTKQFSNSKNIPFNEDLKNDAAVRNKKKAFNDAQVRELIVKNDGGFLIVAENAYTSTRTEMAPGWGYYSWYSSPNYPDRSIREYHFGDILLLNFDDSSHLAWHQFIRKNQYSQDDNGAFSSYAFLNTGASLAFLFNDFNARSNKIEIAAIDGQGQMQMQELNPGDIGNANWLPREAKQVSKTAWIIPIINRNNLFFAKVVF
jgi:hypothetical protein